MGRSVGAGGRDRLPADFRASLRVRVHGPTRRHFRLVVLHGVVPPRRPPVRGPGHGLVRGQGHGHQRGRDALGRGQRVHGSDRGPAHRQAVHPVDDPVRVACPDGRWDGDRLRRGDGRLPRNGCGRGRSTDDQRHGRPGRAVPGQDSDAGNGGAGHPRGRQNENPPEVRQRLRRRRRRGVPGDEARPEHRGHADRVHRVHLDGQPPDRQDRPGVVARSRVRRGLRPGCGADGRARRGRAQGRRAPRDEARTERVRRVRPVPGDRRRDERPGQVADRVRPHRVRQLLVGRHSARRDRRAGPEAAGRPGPTQRPGFLRRVPGHPRERGRRRAAHPVGRTTRPIPPPSQSDWFPGSVVAILSAITGPGRRSAARNGKS